MHIMCDVSDFVSCRPNLKYKAVAISAQDIVKQTVGLQ